jgi:hypothetical protein
MGDSKKKNRWRWCHKLELMVALPMVLLLALGRRGLRVEEATVGGGRGCVSPPSASSFSAFRAPLKLLCDNMKYQILSRAFYGCAYRSCCPCDLWDHLLSACCMPAMSGGPNSSSISWTAGGRELTSTSLSLGFPFYRREKFCPWVLREVVTLGPPGGRNLVQCSPLLWRDPGLN